MMGISYLGTEKTMEIHEGGSRRRRNEIAQEAWSERKTSQFHS